MQSVSFEFLRPENDLLANLGGLAESVLHIDPGSALTRLRSFAEELTKSIYKEELLPRLPQSSFYELIKSQVFDACVSKSLIHQINFLRIQGNDTAHCAEGDLRNAHTLFMCDRKELRVQADDAFKQNLSSEPSCVFGEPNLIGQSARIYFASYAGKMNRFAQLDAETIKAHKYDLSINCYKEVVYEEEQYESPKKILQPLKALGRDISKHLDDLEAML